MMNPQTRSTRMRTFALWSLIALASSSAQVSPATAQVCVGDCSGDGSATVDEIVTMVNIALGTASVDTCAAADPSGDGAVTVDEILQAVNNALNGCPPVNGCTTAKVTVMLDFDPSAAEPAGVTVELAYPSDSVSIPGSGSAPEVAARVADASGAGGFFSVADIDTDSDGTDDQLVTSALVVGASYSPGPFEEAVFDCADGADLPVPGDFACVIDTASDGFGNPIDPSLISCSLAVGAP